MDTVILDGELTRGELARVSVRDRGFLRGEVIRIAVRVVDSVPLRLERHIDRLARTLSAPEVALPFAASVRQLERDIASLCARTELYDGIAHFLITPGETADLLPRPENPPRTHTLLYLEPLDEYKRLTEQGVRLFLSPLARLRGDRLAQLCLGGGWNEMASLRLARREGFDCALISDAAGNALGGAGRENLFAVAEGTLITPHVEKDGVYPGVCRELVLEVAAQAGMVAYQEPLTPQLCAKADELFLTSSALEIAPVRELAGRKWSTFPISAKLLLACRDRLCAGR